MSSLLKHFKASKKHCSGAVEENARLAMLPDTIQGLIKRRRLQMCVHSYIYYHLHKNIISDEQWQAWADELATAQKDNPDACYIGMYDDEFADWTGATGMHLPQDDRILRIANSLLRTMYRVENGTGFLYEITV